MTRKHDRYDLLLPNTKTASRGGPAPGVRHLAGAPIPQTLRRVGCWRPRTFPTLRFLTSKRSPSSSSSLHNRDSTKHLPLRYPRHSPLASSQIKIPSQILLISLQIPLSDTCAYQIQARALRSLVALRQLSENPGRCCSVCGILLPECATFEYFANLPAQPD